MKKIQPDNTSRQAVYSKDVARITRRTPRSGARLLAKIRKKLGKRQGAIVTVAEFCAFMGMLEKEFLWVIT